MINVRNWNSIYPRYPRDIMKREGYSSDITLLLAIRKISETIHIDKNQDRHKKGDLCKAIEAMFCFFVKLINEEYDKEISINIKRIYIDLVRCVVYTNIKIGENIYDINFPYEYKSFNYGFE